MTQSMILTASAAGLNYLSKNLSKEYLDKSVLDITKEVDVNNDRKIQVNELSVWLSQKLNLPANDKLNEITSSLYSVIGEYCEDDNKYAMQLKTLLGIAKALVEDPILSNRDGDETTILNITANNCSDVLHYIKPGAARTEMQKFHKSADTNKNGNIELGELALWAKNACENDKLLIMGYDIAEIQDKTLTEIITLLNNDKFAKSKINEANKGLEGLNLLAKYTPETTFKELIRTAYAFAKLDEGSNGTILNKSTQAYNAFNKGEWQEGLKFVKSVKKEISDSPYMAEKNMISDSLCSIVEQNYKNGNLGFISSGLCKRSIRAIFSPRSFGDYVAGCLINIGLAVGTFDKETVEKAAENFGKTPVGKVLNAPFKAAVETAKTGDQYGTSLMMLGCGLK